MTFDKLKAAFQAWLWKPWVRNVDGVQISPATPRSYYVQIGEKRSEICYDVLDKMETIIHTGSLTRWIQPVEMEMNAEDREKISQAVLKFMTDHRYKARLEE